MTATVTQIFCSIHNQKKSHLTHITLMTNQKIFDKFCIQISCIVNITLNNDKEKGQREQLSPRNAENMSKNNKKRITHPGLHSNFKVGDLIA